MKNQKKLAKEQEAGVEDLFHKPYEAVRGKVRYEADKGKPFSSNPELHEIEKGKKAQMIARIAYAYLTKKEGALIGSWGNLDEKLNKLIGGDNSHFTDSKGKKIDSLTELGQITYDRFVFGIEWDVQGVDPSWFEDNESKSELLSVYKKRNTRLLKKMLMLFQRYNFIFKFRITDFSYVGEMTIRATIKAELIPNMR